MKLLCTIGLHKWEECRCSRCGAQRDTEHSWNGCQCSVCKKVRNEGHEWELCYCKICDLENHKWEHCRCRECGKDRDKYHLIDSNTCKCEICGLYEHAFQPFRCATCDDSYAEGIRELWVRDVHKGDLKKNISKSKVVTCEVCKPPTPEYGPFICYRCSRKLANIHQMGAYLWEVALSGGFALAISRTTFGAITLEHGIERAGELYGNFHSVLYVRIQNLLYRTIFALQQLAVMHRDSAKIRELKEACKGVWKSTERYIEHQEWGENVKISLGQFILVAWGNEREVSQKEIEIYISKALPFSGKGCSIPANHALDFLNRRTRDRTSSTKLSTAKDGLRILSKTDRYSVGSIGMQLGPVLHLCMPTALVARGE